MIDESRHDDPQDTWPDARTTQALAAVLAIDAATAARVRDRSPSRRRIRPQYGPQLDLGGDRGPDDDNDGSAAAGSGTR